MDDGYLTRLDSLARFYNSQTTAHVGYLISVSAFLFGGCLAISTSVVFWTGNYHAAIGLDDRFVRIAVPLFLLVVLFLWALGRFTFSLKYLLGGVQYNVVLSYMVFEHMGLLQHIGSDHVRMLSIRAWRSEKGIEGALRSLFEARLFASKCMELGIRTKERQRRQREYTRENRAKFDVQGNEVELVSEDYFNSPILISPSRLQFLGFTQRELLFVRYRGYTNDERHALMQKVFDP
jgi:hypothetical protein